MSRTSRVLGSAVAAAAALIFAGDASAVGGFGGQDLYHVPMSWCVVDNSPAEANPNINGDTDTDAVIWRRHERPTDNILVPQAGISLRSAINNAWGSFNFPIIADPDTSNVCGAFSCATESDIRGEDVNLVGAEFNAMINACQTAYNALGRAGIGITAVNLGLYHNGTPDYVGVIGWGGCAQTPAGNCAVPYNGLIGVVDNRYLFPGVPNRTFPGDNPSSGFAFTLTDPMDQLVGHEVGHALSLPHRNNPMALMNPGMADNNADALADNIALNAAEIAALRANVLNVPGLEIDPPGVFDPGPWQATIIPDEVDRQVRPHMDIASLRVMLNANEKQTKLSQQLAGLFPDELAGRMQYCFLIDEDDDPRTGAGPEALKEIGISDAGIIGVELVACVDVDEKGSRGIGWRCVNEIPGAGGPTDVSAQGIPSRCVPDAGLVRAQLLSMVVHPHFLPTNDEKGGAPVPDDGDFPIHDIVEVELMENPLVLGRPVPIQALIQTDGETMDTLGDGGAKVVVDQPSFPHCFPQDDGEVGAKVAVDYEGLPANVDFHALLGPTFAASGTTGPDGAGTVDIPIPVGTSTGPRLVTIGPNKTALTADCTVNVIDPRACDGDFDQDGDVDPTDARRFGENFGRRDCRVPGDDEEPQRRGALSRLRERLRLKR